MDPHRWLLFMVLHWKIENLLPVWGFMSPNPKFSSHGLMNVKAKFPKGKINNGSKIMNPN